MKKYIPSLFLPLIISISVRSATCVALVSADWSLATTWSCGHVPTCGDSIVIPVGKTVTISTMLNYSGCVSPMEVVVSGTLTFTTGNKLQLPCNSKLYLPAGGTINPGGGGGNSNLISICGTNYWSAGEGPITGPQCFNCVLPIQLKEFSALCNGETVNVTWATATETNNNYFSVERCDDGYSWAEVAHIKGAGTSSEAHYYTWNDAEPLPGAAYYRLKQTDLDGNYTYPSSIVSTSCNKDGVITVYPNPANANVYCKLNSGAAQTISIEIISVLGQTLAAYNEHIGDGVSTVQFNTEHLGSGTYLMMIQFSNSATLIRKTFVVSK